MKGDKPNAIHPSLDFEQRRVQEAQIQLDFVNKVIWNCQGELGADFVRKQIWTYGCGIEFKELSKSEFSLIKDIINRHSDETLPDMKKESNQYSLQLSAQVIVGSVLQKDDWTGDEEKMKPVDTTISFKWGIPDTCEIVESTTKEAVRDSSAYTIDDNGQIYKSVTTKTVKCNKPLLEAVFTQQEANG